MPSFKIIELLKKILKVLAIYGHGSHLGHVIRAILQIYAPPPSSLGGSTYILALTVQAVSEMFKNDSYIVIYVSIPGEGADNHLGSFFSKACLKLLSI